MTVVIKFNKLFQNVICTCSSKSLVTERIHHADTKRCGLSILMKGMSGGTQHEIICKMIYRVSYDNVAAFNQNTFILFQNINHAKLFFSTSL